MQLCVQIQKNTDHEYKNFSTFRHTYIYTYNGECDFECGNTPIDSAMFTVLMPVRTAMTCNCKMYVTIRST